MDQEMTVQRPESEEVYQAWVHDHPYGFVINASKVPTQAPAHMQGMTWHHADCRTIDPTRHKRLVSGATMKACSSSPTALAIWAVERGEALTYCAVCCRNWRSASTIHD